MRTKGYEFPETTGNWRPLNIDVIGATTEGRWPDSEIELTAELQS